MLRSRKKKKCSITPIVTGSALLAVATGSYVAEIIQSHRKGPFGKLGSQVDSITRRTLQNVEQAARKTKREMGVRPGEKTGKQLDAFTAMARNRIKNAGTDLRQSAHRIDKTLKNNRIAIKAK